MKKLMILDNIVTTAMILIVLKYFSIIFQIDFLDQIQNTLQDFYVSDIVFSKIRNYDKIEVDTNIVLVNIGYLDRRGFARQIDIINKYRPEVIGIDAFFRSDSGAIDEPLRRSLKRCKHLVMVSELKSFDPEMEKEHFDTLIRSNNKFSQYAHSGFANIIIGSEDFRIARDFSPREMVGKTTVSAFPVTVTKLYNQTAYNNLIKRGNRNEKINYKRNINKYKTFDVIDVFRDAPELEALRGKIVLMGFLGPDLQTLVTEDNFFTPMNKQYVGKSYPDMYGIVIHANTISMILEGSYIYKKPEWITIVFVVLLCYFNMWLYTYIRTHYETFYEPSSVTIVFIEMIILFLVIIYSLQWLDVELFDPMVTAVFFALLITPMIYELYHDSLKPLAITYVKKFKRKRKK